MPSKTQSILLAGVAMGVAGALVGLVPAVGGCLACLLYLGAGLLAAWHYTSTFDLTITGGQGAGLGALAGVVTIVTSSIMSWLFGVLGLAPKLTEAMEEAVRQMRDSGMEPSQVDAISDFLTSPLALVAIFTFSLIVGSLLGAVGGAIGAAMFKKGPAEATDTF